ncbi:MULTISPECIES: glutathione binding-like protein [unclassified Iodidimonas]|uniref:glutathione binding-like protein n=1 Tax=unclassified Iodidimonas TaxID=2626145 RepID=UPI002482B2E1|nr:MULTISPECIES: glutathione binding-like protein [unclassified Iodidimonas]
MIDLYTWATPNGHKASIMLEECALEYTVFPTDIGQGLQKRADFLSINPNGKIPALVDHDGPSGDITVFESVSILLYLAEKTGKFLPEAGEDRYRAMNWVIWQAANLGPMMGQAFHFYHYAPHRLPYAIERYRDESSRLLSVMDNQLSKSAYLAGDDYSIADIASFSWTKFGLKFLQEETQGKIPDMPHIQRWLTALAKRPAVQKGVCVPDI